MAGKLPPSSPYPPPGIPEVRQETPPAAGEGETESDGHAGYNRRSFNINQNLEWTNTVQSTNQCWCPVQRPTAESERERENRKRALSLIVTLSVNVFYKKQERKRQKKESSTRLSALWVISWLPSPRISSDLRDKNKHEPTCCFLLPIVEFVF